MAETSHNHIYGAVRREFEETLAEFTLILIPCTAGEQEAALESRKLDIRTHIAGPAIMEEIRNDERPLEGNYFPFYYAEAEEKRLFGLIKRCHSLAIVFVNTEHNAIFEDEAFSIKCAAYAAICPALHAYLKNRKKINLKTTTEDPNPKVDTIRARLMADAFAAMALESRGEKGAIQQILKRYCALATEKAGKIHPDQHPLPLAMDGIYVVYRDLKDDIPPKSNKLEHLHFMASEITNTYDDANLLQWVRFSYAAQDMAWGDYKPNQVLSAAIYGTENPYIRSIAHICAESLNTAPVPLKSTDIYNPFADFETGQRAHVRLGRIKFLQLMEEINDGEDPDIFIRAALKQTNALLKGRPLGWCAPALIEAENACRLYQENPLAEEDMINNAFEDMFTKIRWEDLRKFNRKLNQWKQSNGELSLKNAPDAMDMMFGDDQVYKPYCDAIRALSHK